MAYNNSSRPVSTFDSTHKHLDSMMASLDRRLQVAQAAQNGPLIDLLKQERQQLRSAQAAERGNFWSDLRKTLSQSWTELFGSAELQVQSYQNGSDQWWYAFDPRTGQCLYADSEAELRLWIEQNYRGR